jgi:hypothetical protein
MGDTGLEHSPLASSKTAISQNMSAKSGALDDKIGNSKSTLSWLVEHWPELPEHIKAAIKALIQICKTEKK